MFSIKAGMFVLLLSLAFNGAGSCEAKKSDNAGSRNQTVNRSAPVNRQPESAAAKDDLKALAQGQQSRMRNAFVAVARDIETYEALKALATGMPDLNRNYFESNLVVAAFLGERPTGGYGVRFRSGGDKTLRIEETTPPRDAMVIQVITTPFSVVGVPVIDQESLALDIGPAWSKGVRSFRVREGEFQMSGGITGRTEKFGIAGSLGLMREGNLATLIFNLQSREGERTRTLKDAASGLVQADGSIAIARLGAGSFVDSPADALRSVVQFAGQEKNLSLTFESIPGIIADGFNGRGALKAEAAPQSTKDEGVGRKKP